MKAAAIQFLPVMGRTEENRRQLTELVVRAAEKGADIVVVPETALQGYMTPDGSRVWRSPDFDGDEREVSLKGVAEPVPGPSTRVFARLAARLGIHLLLTLIEVDPVAGKYYNTAVLFDGMGKTILHCRKANPWTVAEYAWAEDGPDRPAVVDTPLGRVGVCICFDIHEMLPRLAEENVDVVLWPVWWIDHSPDVWFQERLPFLCKKHGVHLVAANRASVGAKNELPGAGWSCVVARDGRILTMAEHGGKTVVSSVLPARTPGSRPD